jgi:hypothetical protein
MVRRCAIRWFSLAAALCTSAVLPGCKQSEGDRCEVDNDCTAGLLCDNPTGTSGHCSSRPGTTLPAVDSAAPARLDGGALDATRDVTVPDVAPDSVDARAPDAAVDAAADLAAEAVPRDALADSVPVD